jgi:hypothetical protein
VYASAPRRHVSSASLKGRAEDQGACRRLTPRSRSTSRPAQALGARPSTRSIVGCPPAPNAAHPAASRDVEVCAVGRRRRGPSANGERRPTQAPMPSNKKPGAVPGKWADIRAFRVRARGELWTGGWRSAPRGAHFGRGPRMPLVPAGAPGARARGWRLRDRAFAGDRAPARPTGEWQPVAAGTLDPLSLPALAQASAERGGRRSEPAPGRLHRVRARRTVVQGLRAGKIGRENRSFALVPSESGAKP